MSYTFKNMADVELLGTMPENANVFVEVDGSTRRAPQVKVDVAGELAVTEALEEVPEGATVLAEVNGEIKRVPGSELGGAAAPIIFSVIEAADAVDTPTYQTVCNYTLEEVNALMLAGASCMLIMPVAAMPASAPATLSAATVSPTVATIQALAATQFDDSSCQFVFLMGSDAAIIYYHPDGTIVNSLLAASES